jgi:endonuclease III
MVRLPRCRPATRSSWCSGRTRSTWPTTRAEEQPEYARSYGTATAAVAGRIASGALTRAYLLLRQHGQELCRRSVPRCSACQLTTVCAYYRRKA